MEKLTLYHMSTCMFCVKVRNFMKEHCIEIEMKDVGEDSEAYDELMRIGGKTQVPCLVINGKSLYESLDIIDWLEKNKVVSNG